MGRQPTKEVELHKCCYCGTRRPLSKDFYKSNSDFFMGTGRLPICNMCLNDLYEIFLDRYKKPEAVIKRMCMMFDLYYDESLIDSSVKAKSKPIAEYIRKLNMIQYKNKSFDTSLHEGFSFRRINEKDSEDYDFGGDQIHPDDVIRWGDGLSATDYSVLRSHYKLLKEANPNYDSNQEIFINDLCYSKMLQLRSIRQGDIDGFNKMSDQYRKTFEKAGLKTVRDTSGDEDFSFGVNIEMIEKYTPAEYYKDKTLYKDFDNIGDYFTRFILRPLKNLMHGTTERDYEFYVKEEDASDEYGDE